MSVDALESHFPQAGEIKHEVVISPVQVVRYYQGLDGANSREDVIKMIGLYPRWSLVQLTPQKLSQLDWYLASKDDPSHISWSLTQNGSRRKLIDVARQYLATPQKELAAKWKGYTKIEDMVSSLKMGRNLKPVIIVGGDRYPNSPESSFIDGVHRALAAMVYYEKFHPDDFVFEAYQGNKASLFERISRRFYSLTLSL
mgnify:CR=1 FL=1